MVWLALLQPRLSRLELRGPTGFGSSLLSGDHSPSITRLGHHLVDEGCIVVVRAEHFVRSVPAVTLIDWITPAHGRPPLQRQEEEPPGVSPRVSTCMKTRDLVLVIALILDTDLYRVSHSSGLSAALDSVNPVHVAGDLKKVTSV